MPRLALIVFIIIAVLGAAASSDAARGTRKQCRQTCGPRITQDCAGFRKGARRACRRAILRACRRVALEMCFVTPATTGETTTTTTTTSLVSDTTAPVTTTTQLVPTTTDVRPTTTLHGTTSTSKTSTTSHATTSTTLFHYAGEWFFFGDLLTDECALGAEPLLDADVTVTHDPGASLLSVDLGTSPTLFGNADAGGFDAMESHADDGGCLVTTVFAAEASGSPDVLNAALGITVTCGTQECSVVWTGDLER